MRAKRSLLTMFLALPLVASVSSALAFTTFADEDRSAELAAQPLHQRYQFSSPTTVTYDRDSIKQGSTAGRVYVADMGAYRIRVLDLAGRLIGELNDADQLLAPDSPAVAVPQIKAPLGIAFLSASEAVDQRLAGLYVNDVAVHRIHFFRTDPTNPDKFYYVTSFGQPGNGGGEDLRLPRNMVVTPQGFIYVSDEFNHRIKAFRINPDAAYAVTLIETHGWQDAAGAPLQAGPIIRGIDRNYGDNSTHYEDYASAPEKRDGFRVPQGMTYFRDAGSGATYLYVADNGNNRLKIFRVDPQTGHLTLYDMLGRFQLSGQADHLKRPRGVRTDAAGNLYVADSFNGRLLKFPNLASSGAPEPVSYRTSRQADAQAQWAYGRLGAHQVEMRTPATAATEDAAFLLPNDVVPLVLADGSLYRENIWAWGYYYQNAQVMLVSDTGNHRIKKCWANSSGTSLLRCSVSKGVGGMAAHEFWGHPRTLAGQLHAVGGMTYLHGSNRLLVSDTSNTRINMYSPAGAYLGRFTGTDVSYGVTGLQSFTDSRYGESVAVLVASDATLPWPYTGDSTLRIYDAGGALKGQYNLTYRTGSLPVPRIAFSNGNYPVELSIRSRACCPGQHEVFVTSFGDYLWRFDYDSSNGSLTRRWHAGGRDASKGNDGDANWALGVNFFKQGSAGTFDTIQDVLALEQRVYVVDRRNQRIQAFDPATGALLGQIGAGGGTYDHPDTLAPDRFFLPVGLAYDRAQDALIVGDSYNMVVRAFDNPDLLPVQTGGRIAPAARGHWFDVSRGTRPGGLFAASQVAVGGGQVFVHSLISNRITVFDWSELKP